MTDVELLQALIDEAFEGNQAAFARAIDRQPAQVNQYLKGRRQLGIEVKMHIEQKLRRQGWFGINTSAPARPGSAPPTAADAGAALSAGVGLEVEALVNALADRLDAFADLAQREAVAEKLRALAFYPDSAKARADLSLVLSSVAPPKAISPQTQTHDFAGKPPQLQNEKKAGKEPATHRAGDFIKP